MRSRASPARGATRGRVAAWAAALLVGLLHDVTAERAPRSPRCGAVRLLLLPLLHPPIDVCSRTPIPMSGRAATAPTVLALLQLAAYGVFFVVRPRGLLRAGDLRSRSARRSLAAVAGRSSRSRVALRATHGSSLSRPRAGRVCPATTGGGRWAAARARRPRRSRGWPRGACPGPRWRPVPRCRSTSTAS